MKKPDQVRLEILRLLCLEEEWIPASRLSAGRSRTAVSNHIAALKRLGYKIESSPARGYRLKSAPDAIHEIELRRVMGENPLAREIHSFDHTDSTSSQAARLADEGAPHGTLVIAEQQTKGRGRLGRSWASPPGTGLYFSLVLRPKIELHRAPQLTLLAATAVASAIERTANLSPQIKWPNDLLLDGKKFCGILTELSGDPDRVRHVILGIGVNVGTKKFPKEIAPLATSLRLALGKEPPPRALLLAALL
ncbi:MAG: biotin--[acetyl-CoA-carboxylase] ligase, partial [Bdellovibrionota bacterium]